MIDNGEKTWKIFPAPLDHSPFLEYNTLMTNPMNYNFDDNFNVDLPAEIEDLHDENCEWEPVDLDDPAFEDDSWDEADSLTSIGWGEDEAYELFDDGGEW